MSSPEVGMFGVPGGHSERVRVGFTNSSAGVSGSHKCGVCDGEAGGSGVWAGNEIAAAKSNVLRVMQVATSFFIGL